MKEDLFCPKCGRHLRFVSRSLTGEKIYSCGHNEHIVKESEIRTKQTR